ncbi:MAG: type II toxin-antitoxin system RelB/DinJ family antitoxin [Defluviitaleaceae bacterium]|nr:type II toxin-antitoxin system RelB/DinJ family antitoxin [Defluviitaleaceae bacterium]
MSTARISVNVDSEVKQNAQKILGEIGLDLTTAIDLLLRTIIQEERIPFNLQTEKAYHKATYKEYVKTELEKAKPEAADSNTKWLTHDEVMNKFKTQREARR